MTHQKSPTPPEHIHIRAATKEDAPAMAEVFFRSFNAPFWQYLIPDTPFMRSWWVQGWTKGLDNPTDRTFVAVDTRPEADGKIVGFSRWQVPQPDGNLEHDSWPEMKPEDKVWDMDILAPFFGGMDANREKVMGKKPHWFLDMLGVHEDYERQGIAWSLILWGTRQADWDGLETMLHASERGQPYYVKNHAFEDVMDIWIPDRPPYGSYHYKTLVRKPQVARS